MSWQPIETAPKDGVTAVLVFQPHQAAPDEMHVAVWDRGENSWLVVGDYFVEHDDEPVTHWMPLPPAPTQSEER